MRDERSVKTGPQPASVEPTGSGAAPQRNAATQRASTLEQELDLMEAQLSDVVRHRAGSEIAQAIDKICDYARKRAHYEKPEERLFTFFENYGPEQLEEAIRALACWLDLANAAEDRQRVRVLRKRALADSATPRESIGAAVQHLVRQGKDCLTNLLDKLRIELVITAHPTEARRRTVRQNLQRIRAILAQIDADDLLQSERDRLVADLRMEIRLLLDTELVRARKPTVHVEVRNGLYAIDSLWHVVPELYRSMRQALAAAGINTPVPTFLRFGSWIGGDRDGNPFVTAEVTASTLLSLRASAIHAHLRECMRLSPMLSISDRRHKIAPRLAEALAAAIARWPRIADALQQVQFNEPYRRFVHVIEFRLQRSAEAQVGFELPDGAYTSAAELISDLKLISQSLRDNGQQELADGPLQEWLDRTAVFGLHSASLDIREHSAKLHEAIDELARHMGLASNYGSMTEAQRQRLLVADIALDQAMGINLEDLTQSTRQTVELFCTLSRVLHTFGHSGLGTLIVSMSHRPSDVLTMLWLSRIGSKRTGGGVDLALPIVPLFETIDDLERCDAVLAEMLAIPEYRQHIDRSGGVQVCMVGYSDSTKDGGYLAANWKLHQAQHRLALAAEKAGVTLEIFHGRGGALGRGGGPTARSILSLPARAVDGRLRMTEQGEVLAERYDDPHIAHRHLEQVTWATMLISNAREFEPDPKWREVMEDVSQRSLAAYRELILHPDFLSYFQQATPIASIELLPMGSRPSRRSDRQSIADLRAIPYTFAWTQARLLITGYYGMGAALRDMIQGQPELLRDMYRRWPWFTALIDNAELAVAKANLAISRRYADLVEPPTQIFSLIEREYHWSREAILAITGATELLQRTPWLQQSIAYRSPCVDALNLAQIQLMRRHAQIRKAPESVTPAEVETLEALLRLSVHAVATGLRTTG